MHLLRSNATPGVFTGLLDSDNLLKRKLAGGFQHPKLKVEKEVEKIYCEEEVVMLRTYQSPIIPSESQIIP